MVSTQRGFGSFSVDDVDAARRFYEDVLGMRVTGDRGFLALHLDSGTTFMVYPKEDHVPASFTVLHLAVDDVDEVVDELGRQGVEMLRYESFDHDERGIVRGFMEGGDGAWFTDPAGNVIGLMDGPGAELFGAMTS
ncbi:putative enzyme related to lactoylglutathione lyase [Isoptericola sp. CG 20/1183]|uniref:Enzyme related to lactoylglutathione lyase n=1 Tax=Isoptericola halotolerans TaxID=300560 RepID=A0ABX5EK13_9MICO|nr:MULTISPECIES: VOC family protein [Isoptericola]MCK0117258.1 VOC family protein [Isoptericola sp. S6320L]PRZ08481.1 putative enzyme related to lactoylglutathione lyase [Isoptericola halotolerans]PRZ11072.1 putative enzyme related to lactoylglutathione lyase [Isoptericola sp. CG 20/1183]